MNTHKPNETYEHAYPFYEIERAFFERAVREHRGIDPNMALGLLESTELYAGMARRYHDLLKDYKLLAEDATTGRGLYGGHLQGWVERRSDLAAEGARLGVE